MELPNFYDDEVIDFGLHVGNKSFSTSALNYTFEDRRRAISSAIILRGASARLLSSASSGVLLGGYAVARTGCRDRFEPVTFSLWA